MSKLLKFFAILALVVGAFAMVPASAQARGGHFHGGHFRGGGFGGGGWGPGWGFGFANPYYYGGPYYYAGPSCLVRVWRGGHWVLRRSWRCY